MQTSKISPQVVSRQAQEEAQEEISKYRKLFDEDSPAEYRGVFFDAEEAIPLLESRWSWQLVIVDMAFYVIFVALLTWLLLDSYNTPSSTGIQNTVNSRVIYNPVTYIVPIASLSQTAPLYCSMPLQFNFSSGTYNTESEGSTAPKSPCDLHSLSTQFNQVSQRLEAYQWILWLFGYTSETSPLFNVLSEYEEKINGNVIPILSDAFAPLGAVRLRQLRVEQGPCMQTNNSQLCNQWLSDSSLLKTPFTGVSTGTVYTFTPSSEVTSSHTIESAGLTYTFPSFSSPSSLNDLSRYSGGYIQDFPTGNLTYAAKQIQTLFEDLWFDSSSSYIFIEFSMMAKNSNGLFVNVQLYFEFSASGAIVPVTHITFFNNAGIPAIWYPTMALAGILLVTYVIAFYYETQARGFVEAFFDWTFFDIWSICFVLVVLGVQYSVMRQVSWLDPFSISSLMTNENNDAYLANFQNRGYQYRTLRALQSFTLILTYLKLFKYTSISRRLSISFGSIAKTKYRLASWCVICIIFDFALVFFLYFGWGSSFPMYADFATSLVTSTFVVLQLGFFGLNDLGKQFILDEMERLWFTSTLIVVVVVLLCFVIFIGTNFKAIVLHGYEKALQEYEDSQHRHRKSLRAMRKANPSHQPKGIWRRLQTFFGEVSLSFSEINTLTAQMKTSPQLSRRHLLSYGELYQMVQDVVADEIRTEIVTNELMTIYAAKLSKVEDMIVLFKQQQIAYLKGSVNAFEVDAGDLVVIDPNDHFGFNPYRNQLWIESLTSGDTIRSWCLVHSLYTEQVILQFEAHTQKMFAILKQMQNMVKDLEMKTFPGGIPPKEAVVEEPLERRASPHPPAYDPWETRAECCVIQRNDKKYDAHHVATDGSHRYLGAFETPEMAWLMIKRKDEELGTNIGKDYTALQHESTNMESFDIEQFPVKKKR